MPKKVLFAGESGLSVAANAGLALLRIFAGISIAAAHGIGKIPPGEGLVTRAGELGFPAPVVFAWAAALSEFLGGIFLALGLFTRLAAFFIACTMLVAILGVHAADPYQKKELAFMYFFVAAAFMLKGSGDWSVDAFLRK
ncbi:MAG TPA: DoxX family protein [Pyrinomonadaceae bacterium]|nr:DoxX family protein [Pyrinomonadaceae bacterium]